MGESHAAAADPYSGYAEANQRRNPTTNTAHYDPSLDPKVQEAINQKFNGR